MPSVINTYFDVYFPRAASVGAELRRVAPHQFPSGLHWMTQAYLVSLYLDCPPGLGLHCPNASAIQALEAAVAAGDITW